MLRTLVETPSVTSPRADLDLGNREVIAHLAGWCETLGFRVEIQTLADPRKQNLIATLGDGSDGLVLAGHTDTVPFDEPRWSSDPLKLSERNGRLYGRGSVDMKGFFASALDAISRVDRGTLRQPIVLIATADEETTMNGARALLERERPSATRCIVGEPTGLQPIRMHKGILMESLHIEGSSGHSSNPALGESALEAMIDAIEAMRETRTSWAKHRNPGFEVPSATLNLGRIEGGDSPNRICPSCALTFDVRLMPSMSIEGTRDELRNAVGKALEGRPIEWALDALVPGVPSFENFADAPMVKATEELTGQAAGSVMFCTESPFFAEMGLDTVVCGAGSIDVAHQPDEYTTREGMESAAALYAALIHRFCGDTP